MAKMIEIRKAILTQLKTIHPRVYFQRAPTSAVYPYLVYNLPNSTDDGTLENFVLDVDAWDNSTNTTAIETLIDSADDVLHRKTVIVGALSMTLYRENRLVLEDDDVSLLRRKYIYQVRVYEEV
jgi:hypothetical protein